METSTTDHADDLKYWASAMLIFILAGIVATIVVQIVFHILLSIAIAIKEREHNDKEIEKRIKAEMQEDERDNIIEMKSTRISFFLTGIGFIAGLVAVYFDYSAVTMLNVIFLSFLLGSIIEGFIQMYLYRKN